MPWWPLLLGIGWIPSKPSAKQPGSLCREASLVRFGQDLIPRAFVSRARELLAQRPQRESIPTTPEARDDDLDIESAIFDPNNPAPVLEIPAGSPFAQPEREVRTWNIALNADELIGLLCTFSWIILMSDGQRSRVLAEARRLLGDTLGIEGDVTVDVQYRSEAWRTRLNL